MPLSNPAGIGTGTLLHCADVSKRFGGFHAVKGMSLDVESGIVSIIGSNGAGKTTFFNCIAGVVRPDSGSIVFNGTRIDGLPPNRVARLGIARTFQTVRVFRGLSVMESMLAAQVPRASTSSLAMIMGTPGARAERRTQIERARTKLDLIGFDVAEDARVDALPLLARRKLEIAQALVNEPKLLLLDEPTAGAAIGETDQLLRIIALLASNGMAAVLIEHNMRVVMDISDRIYVMHSGELLTTGAPAEVQADARVRAVYLGER